MITDWRSFASIGIMAIRVANQGHFDCAWPENSSVTLALTRQLFFLLRGYRTKCSAVAFASAMSLMILTKLEGFNWRKCCCLVS